MVNMVIWSSGRFQYCERLYIVYYKSALWIICAQSESCFGDLIEQSSYLVVWMSDFPLFLQLCHILSCLDVISWSKEEFYFTPNSVCELQFFTFWCNSCNLKRSRLHFKVHPDSHNLTTRLNCPSAILQWADWILCWDEKPNCCQITLTGTNSHRSTWLSGDLQLPHLQLEWAFAKSGSSLLFNQFLSLYLCR